MSLTVIRNGTIIDPANRPARFTGDLWVEGERIVAEPGRRADRELDASGLLVMAGGVDIHSHFLGPKVNAARQMLARTTLATREGVETASEAPLVPDIVATGLRYAGLGYTTAIDAAIPAWSIAQAESGLASLPVVDGGYLVLAGGSSHLLEAIASGDQASVVGHLEQLTAAPHARGIKLVSPGAVHDWKSGFRDPINRIDQPLHSVHTTPRAVVQALARAADTLEMPHPLHIHCNNLGMPGNWQTTLATLQALEGCRGHLAHIQFHSYRGADNEADFGSAVQPLVDWLNRHPEVSVDAGQVMFGRTMGMTADSPLGYYLQQVTGSPWISHDVADQGGCGITPLRYRRRDRINALQWAIGLEWMLRIDNPWQIALSTDHPNGASFLAYPQIIALLMDADLRRHELQRLHPDVLEHSELHEMDRQYSLEEVAIVTRAAPARLLGLTDRGHLGAGAVADIVMYHPGDDIRRLFEFPRMVIKSGRPVIDEGQLREPFPAPTGSE